MKIVYWDGKGLAEYPKLCASYLGLQYTEEFPVDYESWLNDKFTLGLEFPNLPYIVDDEIKVTESYSMPIYFAQKAGKPDFLGVGLDAIKARMVEEVFRDIWTVFWNTALDSDAYEKHHNFAKDEKMNQKAEQISKFLGEKDFFFGYVTYVDILIGATALLFDAHLKSIGAESIILKHSNLAAHSKRVLSLPGIAERVASSSCKKPWIPADMLHYEVKEEY